MSIWGAVKDMEKGHKAYQVPTDEFADVLPPPPPNNTEVVTTTTAEASTTETSTSTNTKSYVRPTEHLPGDHGSAEGENTKPAFTTTGATATKTAAEDIASATNTPTPDEGWFSDLSNLVSNQVWFFVAIGAVLLFAAGAGIFFWRRAVRRRQRDNYTSLRDDEVALGRVGGAPRGAPRTTKELYDAFGEVSDDDDDVDEETALRPHSISHALDTGLHSGFLDDDDPPSGGSGRQQARYRDEPESPVEKEATRSDSPGSGSGSGSSWEHASETR